MVGRKRVLRVIAVLSVAFAAGHLVETLRASTSPRGDLAALVPVSSGPEDVRVASLPRSASLAAGTVGSMPALVGITSVAATTEDRPAGDCTPSLALAVTDQAMIDLALHAPCDLGERVVIRHAGLSFTARTGADGRLALRLPALEAEALVAAYFEGSEVALAKVAVSGLDDIARFAFQMGFPVQFDLRAEEGGHVFAASSAGPAGAGRIVTLGNAAVADPILAQVYTFPADSLSAADLTVELRVTAATCSRTFAAETVTSVAGAANRHSLSVALPLCGTAGDILVLKNLVRDPTLSLPN